MNPSSLKCSKETGALKNGLSLPDRIGVIAGASEFPFLVAESIKKISPSSKIFTVILTEETDKRLKDYSSELQYIQPGMLGEIIKYFSDRNIDKAVMVGVIKHKKIFDGRLELDPLMKKVFLNIKDNRADSILSAIADEFGKNNIEILPLLGILKNHIAGEGLLAGKEPDLKQQKDIEFGFDLAKQLSKFDIGQTIVVKDRCIVAVEALEGTDLCILRSGELAGENTVVIKVAKYSQDFRFDMPIVGINTLKNMAKVSSKAIVVESGKTCLVNKVELIDFSKNNGLSIIGMNFDNNYN